MKRKCFKKLVFFPNMIVVTVITKITLFSLTMRNKNNAIFSVFFSFSSSLYSSQKFSDVDRPSFSFCRVRQGGAGL
jgi:hypothetical protein